MYRQITAVFWPSQSNTVRCRLPIQVSICMSALQMCIMCYMIWQHNFLRWLRYSVQACPEGKYPRIIIILFAVSSPSDCVDIKGNLTMHNLRSNQFDGSVGPMLWGIKFVWSQLCMVRFPFISTQSDGDETFLFTRLVWVLEKWVMNGPELSDFGGLVVTASRAG